MPIVALIIKRNNLFLMNKQKLCNYNTFFSNIYGKFIISKTFKETKLNYQFKKVKTNHNTII